jgi:hypothetical protein
MNEIDWNEPVIGNPEELRPLVPEEIAKDYEMFDVQGTGLLFFSKSANHLCGNARGFSVNDSASQYGLTGGGVMDAKEAQRLADHIYAVLGLEK